MLSLSFVPQGGKKGKKSKKAAEGSEAAPEAANGKHKPSMNGDAPSSETTEGRDGEKIEVPSAAKNGNASNGPSGRGEFRLTESSDFARANILIFFS